MPYEPLIGIRPQDRGFAVQVQLRVRQHLRSSPLDMPSHASTVIDLELAGDGQITSAIIAQTSGHVGWDAIALAAVKKASPLPPPQDDTQRHFTITVRPAA